MPRTITKKIYKFSELRKSAKRKAIDDYLASDPYDWDWWDSEVEYIADQMEEAGFQICRLVKRRDHNGEEIHVPEPQISFDLYHCTCSIEVQDIAMSKLEIPEFDIIKMKYALSHNSAPPYNIYMNNHDCEWEYDNQDADNHDDDDAMMDTICEKVNEKIKEWERTALKWLRAEWDGMHEDDYVSEHLIANDYEFDWHGERQ